MKADYAKGEHNYLYHTYDAYVYYPHFTATNILSMVRNAVIEGLNDHLKFPSAIILLTGHLFINHEPYFLPSEMEKKIRWLLREISSSISIRKSQLEPKCFVLEEPRIIWIRGFQVSQRNLIAPDHLLKFNNMLRRICSAKAYYSPDLELFVTAELGVMILRVIWSLKPLSFCGPQLQMS